MTKRDKTKQLLVQLGFTAREIKAAEELAASREISVCQLLRNGLRISQAQHKGLLAYTWLNDKPVGCGVAD